MSRDMKRVSLPFPSGFRGVHAVPFSPFGSWTSFGVLRMGYAPFMGSETLKNAFVISGALGHSTLEESRQGEWVTGAGRDRRGSSGRVSCSQPRRSIRESRHLAACFDFGSLLTDFGSLGCRSTLTLSAATFCSLSRESCYAKSTIQMLMFVDPSISSSIFDFNSFHSLFCLRFQTSSLST